MAANSKPIILYDNLFEDSTLAATDTDSDTQYDVLNILDWKTYTYWKAASSGTKYLTADYGSNYTPDSLFIFGHNLSSMGATVSLEYSSDNFSADVHEAVAGFAPSNDKAIAKVFTGVAARYWRIKLSGCTGAPYIAIAVVGARLTMEKYCEGNFDPNPMKIRAEGSKSAGGNPLASVIEYYEVNIRPTFKRLTPSWVTNTFRTVWINHIALLKPFAWVWDITNHPTEIYLGKVPDDFDLRMPYDAGPRQSLEFEIEALYEED